MSKILAIDFGLKRCGLAITDDSNTFAFGLDTVSSDNLGKFLEKLIAIENIGVIVIGLPKRMNNSDTAITQNVLILKEALSEKFREVRIELYDERFTSKMAAQSMHFAGAKRKQKQQKGLVDKVSATLILQSYLSSKGTH